MRHLLNAVLAVVLLGVAVHAQTFRGAINGTVTDPSGAVIANAKVTVTNAGTSVANSTVTTSDGQFSFQDLPLGQYKITVSASGFPATTIDKIAVTAGSVYTLPVTLKLGESTTVEVSAAALEVDTTSATQSNTIPEQAIQNVPMNGRDFTQFIAVQPGYGGYSVGGFGSLNGTRANQMNWQIDGVDNNDFWHNIPAVNQGGVSGIAGVVMPLDAVDEFSAQSQSNAESGRNAGGIVNLVLKAGTNQLHGSAYYYNRNEAFASASPFTPDGTKKPELRNENYGFSLGGPIFKDKTFYFVSFEKQQYVIGLSGVATEPSGAYQTAALTLIGGPGNESPISKQLMANLWPSTIDNLAAHTDNFFSPVASTGYSYNGVIKLDHNFTDKEHFSIRWFGGQGSQTAPLGGSPALATASSNLSYYFEKAPIHVYNYAAVLNSTLSDRMTNQILFGVNYFNQTFNDANHSFDTSAMGLDLSPDALIKGQPILGAPNIQISGFEQVGITPPEGRNDITGMLSDILSYNVGKHQFRFGGEMRQGHVDEFYFRHSLGAFTFTGSYPGTPWSGTCASNDPTCALADFLAGDVSTSAIAVGNAERKVVVNGFDFFGQDDWQITHKLNLNFGLRYDYYGPLHNGSKDLAVFIPSAGGIKIQGNGIDSVFPQDKNNFAPRFGFAYRPKENGDLVVRGGIGVFYDQINMNPFLDFRPPNNADGLEDNPAGPSPVSTYSLNTYQWQPNTPIFPGIATCISGNSINNPTDCLDPVLGTPLVFDVFSVNQNFRTPYFYNYNLNVEKSLGSAAVFQIGYVGSEGRKLSIMLDINQLPNGAEVLNPISGAMTTEGRYPQFPNYGGINQLNSIGTSNYNALQATLKLRSWHGLTSQVSYTWAHELDEISEYRGALPRDSTNLQAEYGNGDFDTRNNFSAFFIYDVPGSSHGPKMLTHGWQVTSLMTFHGGQPFDETRTGQDLIGDPFAGISHKFSKSGVTWINPAAFAPGSTFEGDVRRNQYYGPGFADVDLSVLKNIPITERVKLQLRAEMFNVFNRINLASGPGSVSGGIVSDTIGDFNGAPGIGPGEAFNMQLAGKIIF